MPSVKTTLFSWGYEGWGPWTSQLIGAVDDVEKARGFEPPFFVDIRIRRSVRAKGFCGKAFEILLGPSRHKWMRSLGNDYILTGEPPEVQIHDPSAAGELLDLAMEIADRRQRLVFFCREDFPAFDGVLKCHRLTVADLVLEEAKKRGENVEVVEWPGGEPQRVDITVPLATFKKVERGRASIPLDDPIDMVKFAGLPWGSLVTVQSDDSSLWVISGPARHRGGKWLLPVFTRYDDLETFRASADRDSMQTRRSRGLDARLSGEVR